MKNIKFYLNRKEIPFEELSRLPQRVVDRASHTRTEIVLHYIDKDAIFFYTKTEHYTVADGADEELFGTPPQPCHHINDFENCICFEPPIEYEKESFPYSLNRVEGKVLFRLFKEYRKDQDKLGKLVEAFESYLSNAVKSPANAEGKCSDEDTLYRIMKERIEDEAEERELI